MTLTSATGRCTPLSELPRSMAERAVRARTLAASRPELVDIDDEFLPWIYDTEDRIWYSFDGNYSSCSPLEKRQKAEARVARQSEHEERAYRRHEDQIAWSLMRQYVLDRDGHACQICGKVATSRLHIHHILKRRDGGTDTADNLITVCPGCHKSCDTKMYDPEWDEPQRLDVPS